MTRLPCVCIPCIQKCRSAAVLECTVKRSIFCNSHFCSFFWPINGMNHFYFKSFRFVASFRHLFIGLWSLFNSHHSYWGRIALDLKCVKVTSHKVAFTHYQLHLAHQHDLFSYAYDWCFPLYLYFLSYLLYSLLSRVIRIIAIRVPLILIFHGVCLVIHKIKLIYTFAISFSCILWFTKKFVLFLLLSTRHFMQSKYSRFKSTIIIIRFLNMVPMCNFVQIFRKLKFLWLIFGQQGKNIWVTNRDSPYKLWG